VLRDDDATPADLPASRRMMVAVVRLAARDELRYDTADWELEDETGRRWEALEETPGRALGAGTLAPRDERTGQVAFAVPRDVEARSVVLTDGNGTDLVVFARS
jgi:hypothetical protein